MKFLNRNSFPFFKQIDQYDCGPSCLKMVSKHYGRNFSSEHLRGVCNITSNGITIKSLIQGAESIGFQAIPASINFQTLSDEAPLPCIVYWRDRHFLIVYKIKGDVIYVADPAHGLSKYNKNNFIEAWQNNKKYNDESEGIVILLEPSVKFNNQNDTDFAKGLLGILPYLKNYNKYITQIFIGLLAGSFIQLILPFITQKIVDRGINLGDLNFVYILLLAQLMLFLSQSFLSIIRSWLLLYVGSRINMLIASDYLSKLLSKPVSFFDSKTPGDILQRINETSRIETFLTSVPETLFSYINALIFLFVLSFYSIKIFLIYGLGILLFTFWTWLFMKKRADLDYKRFDQSSGLNSNLVQMVAGIQEIKVNGSEKKHIRAWEKVRIQYFKTSVSSLKLLQMQNIGGNIINEVKNIFVTFTAAILVMDGKITLGGMLAIQYIIGQVNSPLLSLVNFFRTIQDAKLSMQRFNDIEFSSDEEKTISDQSLIKLPTDSYDLHIKNLNFSYVNDNEQLVLKGINLHIPRGKVTAIVGDSGSGKTTLLKLLLKLYLPTNGEILVGNSNLKHVLTKNWSELCGTVMQEGYIFSDTVTQNITESASEEAVDIKRLLYSVKLANLEELINSLPSGFNTNISSSSSGGRSLSGGQKQRVLIARAVYKDPKFLFFDEATSALDANNERIIVDNLKEFYLGKTVIVIAHRLSTVKNADQIIVLEKGTIKEIGKHEDLVKKQGAYYKLIKNQLELGN
jgi:ATP-binding cassette subfamily B protein